MNVIGARRPSTLLAFATPMSGRRRAFALFVAALVVAHVWAPHGGPDPILFGLPRDVLVHLAWMAAAGIAVAWMTSRALWPDEGDSE